MNNYKEQFLKIGKISGIYYSIPGRKTRRIVVYGLGAPVLPDDGKLSDAPTILDFETDLFVPDYIGFGRSEGRFTPKNCIKTFLYLNDALLKGEIGVCNYENLKVELKYKEVHFIGRSFGGTYVLLLPKFNKQITNICSIFPVVDWARVGKNKGHPEETVEQFYQAMSEDGYGYLYRGIFNGIWKKHFSGDDKLSPVDNIKYLKNSKVFIGHGIYDANIYYENSKNFYHKLLEMFPDRKDQFMLKLYQFDHSKKTSNLAIVDYLEWMNVPKIK